MRKSTIALFLLMIAFTACKRSTPAEMLFGHWQVQSIRINGNNVTNDFINKNSKHISFYEDGYVQIGALDDSKNNTWLIYEEDNMVYLPELYFKDIKKWNVLASDEHIELTNINQTHQLYLERIKQKPEPAITSKEQLVGKWIVDKVTINGSDNTSEYQHYDRWILIEKNGRYYNGASDKKQAMGFWETDPSLTKIKFRKSQEKEEVEGLDFKIADHTIWYQKEKGRPIEPSVRIYFKRVN